jgi:hypothetical protein
MRRLELSVAYHLKFTCNNHRILRDVVHLIDFDLLAAEGSPLDLEDGQVYLNAQALQQNSRLPNLLDYPSARLSSFPPTTVF